MLKTIKKKSSIPEPTDPLFKHFHSADIQVMVDPFVNELEMWISSL